MYQNWCYKDHHYCHRRRRLRRRHHHRIEKATNYFLQVSSHIMLPFKYLWRLERK